MMNVTKNVPLIAVGVSEGTVLQVQGDSAKPKFVTLINLDDVNTLTYKWQYSDDGATWTDVGVQTTCAPGDPAYATLNSHVFHRLRASGNLSISAQVTIFQNFGGTLIFSNS